MAPCQLYVKYTVVGQCLPGSEKLKTCSEKVTNVIILPIKMYSKNQSTMDYSSESNAHTVQKSYFAMTQSWWIMIVCRVIQEVALLSGMGF